MSSATTTRVHESNPIPEPTNLSHITVVMMSIVVLMKHNKRPPMIIRCTLDELWRPCCVPMFWNTCFSCSCRIRSIHLMMNGKPRRSESNLLIPSYIDLNWKVCLLVSLWRNNICISGFARKRARKLNSFARERPKMAKNQTTSK
jgi:hypothetical protein